MTNARTIAILTEARAKIADPRNWGQGARYKRINGLSCCASEAIQDATIIDEQKPANLVLSDRRAAYIALGNAIGDPRIVDWNDAPSRTHAEVLAAFTRAIVSLGGRAP